MSLMEEGGELQPKELTFSMTQLFLPRAAWEVQGPSRAGWSYLPAQAASPRVTGGPPREPAL